MLKTILSIAGKPGLYKLVSRGNRSLIVETLDAAHRRMPAFASDRVISLADIAMYTNAEEVPLRQVLANIQKKEDGHRCPLDHKKATREELAAYVAEVLPDYDQDRVHTGDMRKLLQWYNILVDNGETDFEEALQETPGDNIDDRK